jgi:hypothetical protein
MKAVLRCPVIECRKKFPYDTSKGWPDFCPHCKTDINNYRADDDIVCPAFLSPKSKNNDAIARKIMDGSEDRMHLAAAAAGVSSSEMAGLKITDINDRRDAEISAMPVNNPVTQHMAAMGHNPWQGGQGLDAAANAHNGPLPYAGARARSQLQRALPPVGQAPLPLEIVGNPNYRPRV